MQTMIQEAYRALMAKEYDKALELYRALERKEEPTSFYYLGFLYFRGYAVLQDREIAFDYYLKSATREVPLAQFEVALMLENAEGCEKNESESAFWYEESAKRGNIDALNNLGAMYKEGRGVHQDYKKAFFLFSKAAEAGNAKAQFNLGALYDMGLGCEEDKEKAIEYCRKAAYQGHEMAKGIIKRMQNDGQIVF